MTVPNPRPPRGECPWCKEINGCKPTGGKMGDATFLTVKDWEKIYNFMRYVQLPFMHKILADAFFRAEEPYHFRDGKTYYRRKRWFALRPCEPEPPKGHRHADRRPNQTEMG